MERCCCSVLLHERVQGESVFNLSSAKPELVLPASSRLLQSGVDVSTACTSQAKERRGSFSIGCDVF